MTAHTPAPTADPPGVDVAAFSAWLAEEHPELRGDTDRVEIELIDGGRSNLTYRVREGARPMVLRRGPLGHALATAHDMTREATVLRALAGTTVPVPEVLAASAEPVPGIDAPFYLMTFVDGSVLRTRADNAALPEGGARELSFRLVDTLATLHSLPVERVGLSTFGRPDGYLQRQLARWQRQLDASRSRDLPEIDELAGLLARRMPEKSDAALLHGDFRLDNVVVDPGAVRIDAVLDWEMATVGDPLADLALFGFYWDLAENAQELARALPSAIDRSAGYPAFSELVARYAEVRGIAVPDLRWYSAFSAFKLAVIAEGIHYRYTLGKTAGDGFEAMGAAVAPIARLGLAFAARGKAQ